MKSLIHRVNSRSHPVSNTTQVPEDTKTDKIFVVLNVSVFVIW